MLFAIKNIGTGRYACTNSSTPSLFTTKGRAENVISCIKAHGKYCVVQICIIEIKESNLLNDIGESKDGKGQNATRERYESTSQRN